MIGGLYGWVALAAVGVTLVGGIVLQTVRLDAAKAAHAVEKERNKTLTEQIKTERAVRERVAQEAERQRKAAMEARREIQKIKSENTRRPRVGLSQRARDLYGRLQQRLKGNQD